MSTFEADDSNYGWSDWQADQKPEKLRAVVQKLQPVIDSALRNYAGPKAADTVRQRAKLMAAQAVRTYDPTRGKLKQHVFGYLQGLRRVAPQVTDPLAPPERFARDVAELQRGEAALNEQLGRPATDEELAEFVGITPKRIERIRKRARGRVPMSVVERSGADDEDSMNDIVISQKDPYEDWVDAVYHDLPPVDKLILQHRSGYRGADRLGLKEIAAMLKMSPQAVSQRAARIQARLDEYHG